MVRSSRWPTVMFPEAIEPVTTIQPSPVKDSASWRFRRGDHRPCNASSALVTSLIHRL